MMILLPSLALAPPVTAVAILIVVVLVLIVQVCGIGYANFKSRELKLALTLRNKESDHTIQEIYVLVDGAHGATLRLVASYSSRLAAITKDPVDIQAAADARKRSLEHEATSKKADAVVVTERSTEKAEAEAIAADDLVANAAAKARGLIEDATDKAKELKDKPNG